MKTMIIYSSRYGSAADCAKHLEAGLSGSVSLTNIDNTNSETIDLEAFDTIILGSSIYVGAVSKKMKKFCQETVDILSNKRIGIYLCCAAPAQMEEYLSANFPAPLLKKAITIKNFGGEARIDKMKFTDKLILKAATKGKTESLTISHEYIQDFIEKINTNQTQ